MNVLVCGNANLTPNNRCQQTGQAHHPRGYQSTGEKKKNALMFPRQRRRGAIAVTQGRVGLSTRTDHLLTKAADRASAEYVIHNQAPHLTATPDKCGCGDALLCHALLAMLLTQTEAQSGFTTWFLWLLARRKPRPPASCQPHLK